MYTELAKRLAVTDTRQFSQPVSMEGANAALFDYTVYNISGGTLEVQIQGSNDLQNWATLLDPPTLTNPIQVDATTEGYFYTDGTSPKYVATDVGFAYVRLAYEMDSAQTAIINSGIDPFEE